MRKHYKTYRSKALEECKNFYIANENTNHVNSEEHRDIEQKNQVKSKGNVIDELNSF